MIQRSRICATESCVRSRKPLTLTSAAYNHSVALGLTIALADRQRITFDDALQMWLSA